LYLVQLPPSLAFDRESCTTFFERVRSCTPVPFVVEPRHATWFTGESEACLMDFYIGRVAADPALQPIAAESGGSRREQYFRLHGSPQMYYSSYSNDDLRAWHVKMIASNSGDCWCIFDNTAVGAAFQNATTLRQLDQVSIPR
jgi:uncharacterized protein YecE (DUF72 family)